MRRAPLAQRATDRQSLPHQFSAGYAAFNLVAALISYPAGSLTDRWGGRMQACLSDHRHGTEGD
jgi:hypothetical protein